MSLMEPLMASLVFLGSAAAAAQLWVLALGASHVEGERQQRLDRLDAELVVLGSWLRRQAATTGSSGDCTAVAARLAQELPQPEAAGPSAEFHLRADGVTSPGLLEVELTSAAGPEARRRLFSVAALGLCGGGGVGGAVSGGVSGGGGQ